MVACIEDSVVIKKTMTHQVDTAEQPQEQVRDLGVGVLGCEDIWDKDSLMVRTFFDALPLALSRRERGKGFAE